MIGTPTQNTYTGDYPNAIVPTTVPIYEDRPPAMFNWPDTPTKPKTIIIDGRRIVLDKVQMYWSGKADSGENEMFFDLDGSTDVLIANGTENEVNELIKKLDIIFEAKEL